MRVWNKKISTLIQSVWHLPRATNRGRFTTLNGTVSAKRNTLDNVSIVSLSLEGINYFHRYLIINFARF